MPRSASIMSSGLSWVKLRRSSARSHWGISSKSNPTMPASIAFIPTKSTASMLIFYCATPRQYVPSWGSSWMIRVTNAMTARSEINLWIRSLLLPESHWCACRSSTPTPCRRFRRCYSPIQLDASQPLPADDKPQQSWTTPRCTKCGAEMVQRSAKSGPNQGKRFWGCSNYPKCRNVVELEE